MNARFAGSAAVAAGMLLFATLASTGPAVAAAEPGELWETTFEMTMKAAGQNMTMPPKTDKSCRPQGAAWDEPPGGPEGSECEMTDVKRVGSTMTWNMRCSSPPATGKGSIEFQGADSYRGTMSTSMPQGEMTMKMSGRRVGVCDYSATRRAVKDMEQEHKDIERQHTEMMASMCADYARTGRSMAFINENEDPVCSGPQHKAAFCAALATPAGYEGATSAVAGVDIARATAFCGTTPDRLLAQLCQSALDTASLQFVLDRCPALHPAMCAKAVATDQPQFLLGGRCPAEAKKLAAEQCAGLKYTSQSGMKYYQFCMEYSRGEMQQQEAEAAENTSPKQEAVDKAKKRLKGLFGR